LNKNSNGYRFFDSLETAIEAAGLDYDELLPDGNLAPLREFFEASKGKSNGKSKANDVDELTHIFAKRCESWRLISPLSWRANQNMATIPATANRLNPRK
jgi:hypothetical protein